MKTHQNIGLHFLAVVLLLLAACRGEQHYLAFNPGAQPDKTLELKLSGNVNVELPIVKVNEDFNTDITTLLAFDSTSNGTLMTFNYKSFSRDTDTAKQDIRLNEDEAAVSAIMGITRSRFSALVDPQGKAGAVSGLDSFRAAVNAMVSNQSLQAGAREAMKMDSFLTDGTITALIDMAQHVLPGKKVAIGDSWENSAEVSPGVPLSLQRTFTLERISGDTAFISLKSTIKQPSDKGPVSSAGLAWFLPPGESARKQDPANIWTTLMANLNVEVTGSMDGEIAVDKNTGMLMHSHLNQVLQGSMKMGSATIPLRLTMQYHYTMH